MYYRLILSRLDGKVVDKLVADKKENLFEMFKRANKRGLIELFDRAAVEECRTYDVTNKLKEIDNAKY